MSALDAFVKSCYTNWRYLSLLICLFRVLPLFVSGHHSSCWCIVCCWSSRCWRASGLLWCTQFGLCCFYTIPHMASFIIINILRMHQFECSAPTDTCMLNHCLAWYKWVLMNFDHDRQCGDTVSDILSDINQA